MRLHHVTLRVAVAAALVCATRMSAQESLLPNASWGISPVFAMWHFATPIVQSSGDLKDVQQIALPLRARFVLGGRWNFDASGAFASSRITVDNGGTSRTLSVAGLTDIKLRVSSAFLGDRAMVTAGINVPTGATGLDGDQTAVLQVMSAPALHMPVGALGLGTGATLGLVGAKEAGGWALAAGASVEQRAEYTAIELALADGNSSTKVSPGMALHFTLGADRSLGDHRVSVALIGDQYFQDRVTIGQSGSTGETRYTLGAQQTALARLDLAFGGWREANANLAVRHRGAFTDQSGASVDGSSGSYLEASFGGVRGASTGRGIILGADARYHSGFSFSDALVAAANSAAGVTVGVELPYTSTVLRLAVHAQYGHFDTGTTASNGMGISLVGAIAARRGAR